MSRQMTVLALPWPTNKGILLQKAVRVVRPNVLGLVRSFRTNALKYGWSLQNVCHKQLGIGIPNIFLYYCHYYQT